MMRDALIAASSIALAAALLAAASPAAAQDLPPEPPAERIGDWEVRAMAHGSCSAARRFSDGTQVHLFAHEDGYRTLGVFHRDWPITGRPTYRLALLSGGQRRPLVADNPQLVGSSGLSMPLSEAQLGEVAKAEAVEVLGPDGAALKRVELAGFGAAAAHLPFCFRQAAAYPWRLIAPPAPPPPPPAPRPTGKERRAVPRVPLHRLISANDYPAAALEADEEGRVGYRLEVDWDGRVAGCTIVLSSGSAALDAGTCQLLTSRARFEPARDGKGRRVADRVPGRVVWTIEEPPPEPDPVE
jgi:TonB family protein